MLLVLGYRLLTIFMSNLLPHNHIKLVKRLYKAKTISVTIWFLIAMTVFGVVLFLPTLFTINSRFGIAQHQIKTLEQSGELVSPVDIALYEKTVEGLLQSLAAPQPLPPTRYINILTNTLTPGVTLTGFEILKSDDRIMVRTGGIATTRESLQAYLIMLEQHDMVAMVDNPISNYIGSRDTEFSVVVTFNKE